MRENQERSGYMNRSRDDYKGKTKSGESQGNSNSKLPRGLIPERTLNQSPQSSPQQLPQDYWGDRANYDRLKMGLELEKAVCLKNLDYQEQVAKSALRVKEKMMNHDLKIEAEHQLLQVDFGLDGLVQYRRESFFKNYNQCFDFRIAKRYKLVLNGSEQTSEKVLFLVINNNEKKKAILISVENFKKGLLLGYLSLAGIRISFEDEKRSIKVEKALWDALCVHSQEKLIEKRHGWVVLEDSIRYVDSETPTWRELPKDGVYGYEKFHRFID